MTKRLTTEEFIKKARAIHGDKYDYSKVIYVNNHTKVCIICPVHGEFWQNPHSHLKGMGCKKCAVHCVKQKSRKMVYGKGVLDVDFSCRVDAITSKAYKIYGAILGRCYGEKQKTHNPAYEGCWVCDEWLLFSNFLSWFKENYINGYCVDKDILCKGNKCYCPEYCCFVPRAINSLITNRKNHRGSSVIGVFKRNDGKYIVHCNKYGKSCVYGAFNTEMDAFNVYKNEKESYIKEVADDYYNKGLITKRVHDALYNWTIEITD